ncbi:hypothetical protein CFC21_086426 [Triticum aestivum]|uniref:Uncharacterized protein n=2 Tax=Triticum aestivum TaxID=4565 RepID=A0A3B6PEF7_WHEAT|nr:putative F-box/LRR-repeat/kelch-repeat protein At1g11620 [Triticum aestivum]XP_044410803.1 putative F-box/LRR-repeat/kelch-repeat protein At1g11620 [Triticum aestivum]KAF7082559.1 hypothetical protein CFC21_086426 [Triticum aestivum]
MSSPRRRPLSPAPLDDDDLLSEILLRLPALPSSLPRASAVCRRWRRLASDPRFCRRFRAHHRRRNPPLLGCFVQDIDSIHFQPILEAPNRVPQARFAFPIHAGDPLGCRHGLVLFLRNADQLLVWDPITGDQHRLDVPPGFDEDDSVGGAVLRSAAGHFQFQVVLVGNSEIEPTRAVACVYSSATGEWGDLVSTPLPPKASMSYRSTSISMNHPCVLIEGSCYWSLAHGPGILAFDLDSQSLSVIHLPVDLAHYDFSVVRAEGGRLGFFVVPGFSAQLWKWNRDCDGAASWVLERSIELDKLLTLNPDDERERPTVAGFAEESNVVLLWSFVGVFTLQLQSLHSRKLFRVKRWFCCLPFEGVYTADADIGAGGDGAKLLHNT